MLLPGRPRRQLRSRPQPLLVPQPSLQVPMVAHSRPHGVRLAQEHRARPVALSVPPRAPSNLVARLDLKPTGKSLLLPLTSRRPKARCQHSLRRRRNLNRNQHPCRPRKGSQASSARPLQRNKRQHLQPLPLPNWTSSPRRTPSHQLGPRLLHRSSRSQGCSMLFRSPRLLRRQSHPSRPFPTSSHPHRHLSHQRLCLPLSFHQPSQPLPRPLHRSLLRHEHLRSRSFRPSRSHASICVRCHRSWHPKWCQKSWQRSSRIMRTTWPGWSDSARPRRTTSGPRQSRLCCSSARLNKS